MRGIVKKFGRLITSSLRRVLRTAQLRGIPFERRNTMSMQFDEPMNEETAKRIKEMFGEKIAVMDDRNVLLEKLAELHQQEMKIVANTAEQPVTVNIHDEGDIVTMSDGTRYRVTAQGWRKV